MRFRPRSRSSRLLYGSCAVGLAAAAWYFLTPPTYSVSPGPFADDPRCSDVVSEAPGTVLAKNRDGVDGAGTAAWGDASIVLRCGVEPLLPTPDPCVDVNGVDWVLDEARAEEDGVKVLTTYGRTPAVEVTLGDERDVPGDVLVVLNRSVEDIPQKSECIALSGPL